MISSRDLVETPLFLRRQAWRRIALTTGHLMGWKQVIAWPRALLGDSQQPARIEAF